jgi:hypothetical protein
MNDLLLLGFRKKKMNFCCHGKENELRPPAVGKEKVCLILISKVKFALLWK